MLYKQHGLLVLAIACTQIVLCGWLTTLVQGAENPVAPTAPVPRVSVIKDGSMMEVFLRFSPDGRELARIPRFGPVRLSDTASYKKMRTFNVGMRMVAYSPDGTKMATAEGTDGARVWDTAVQGTLIPEAAPAEMYALETPLQVLQKPSKDAKQRVFWTEFSPDGKHLITTHANGHVKVWNTSSWTVEDDLTLTDSEVRVAAFAPDSKTLVIGDVKGALHQWNFANKTEMKTGLTSEPFGAVMGVVFAPDGKTLVTIHQSGSKTTVRIWNTSTWVAQVQEGFSAAAFSKDGKVLALGGGNIKLLDPASGKEIRTIELPEMTLGEFGLGNKEDPDAAKKIPIQISALAFSPDGGTLAVGDMGPLRLVKMTPP
jgi:WD40 repeat protein